LISLLDGLRGFVARGETWGAQLSGKLGGIDVVVAGRREDLVRSFAAKEPDPLDGGSQRLRLATQPTIGLGTMIRYVYSFAGLSTRAT
jgi:hypothetical protein